MVEYWLALTLCLAAADGEVCGLRLVPLPLDGPLACQRLAAMIMQADPAYRMPLQCTRERPTLPEMPGATPPDRFA
jgi:hypothetical protein